MNAQYLPLFTLITKEVRRIFRAWIQTILSSIITTSLYYLVFGHIIAQRIGPMLNAPYGQFIVPGLAGLGIITNSYANVSSSFFIEKFQKSIEALLSTPLSSEHLIFGFLVGGVFRGLLVSLIITSLGLYFSHSTLAHPLFFLGLSILAAAVFASLGLMNALFAKKFDDISFIPTFLLTPLIYLGGVFFPLSLLPAPWHDVAHFNPIAWIVSGLHYSILNEQTVNPSGLLFGLMLCAILLYYILVILCKRRIGVLL